MSSSTPTPTRSDFEERYSIKEVKALTKLGKSFIYDAMKRRELRFEKVGARRLIPRRALLKWWSGIAKTYPTLEEHKRESAA